MTARTRKITKKRGGHTLPPEFLLWIILISFLSCHLETFAQKGKIAIFGSSVANGSGDTTGNGGYAGLLKIMLEKRGWEVVNVSRGGDNTTKILPRFESQLLPEKPKYVIIGLSLGNEGITASTELARERNFEKFRSGMLRLVHMCWDNNMYPIVVNCYARNDFKEEQYQATKRMNLLINTWDVPGVNVLGTIDNGSGNWLEQCYHDKSHPNFIGHQEMYYAFVPSLFDAIESGIKVPQKIKSSNYLEIIHPETSSPLSFKPGDPFHSFSICFECKLTDNGTLAAIKGAGMSLLKVDNGKITYKSTTETEVSADTVSENKGWQYVVITHQYLSGITSIFINGKSAGSVKESIYLDEFILGGGGDKALYPSPAKSCFRNFLIYRSALNTDEVKALYFDQLLTSSLEVYCPLNDLELTRGSSPKNYAQSLSKVVIDMNHSQKEIK
jgi:lysophospholipase L1-like esterase